jgi:UDP-glucose 4-epimerase
MTTLVVGGSGFIGHESLKVLAKNGVDLISYDKMPVSSGETCKCLSGDILDLSSVGRILSEYPIDTVLHLVGLPVVESCEKNPNLSFLLNVMSVQNTLEAMRLNDVRKIIFASSATVYGVLQSEPIRENDPPCPNSIYGYHKLIAEHVIKSYAQTYGLDYNIFRLFNVYGANPKLGKEVISIFIRKALKGEPLLVKGPKKFRDFVHLSDVAQAFLKAHMKKGAKNLLNIGSGTKTSLAQIAIMVKEFFPEIEVTEESAPDDGTGLQADISLARSVLDFEPTPPEKGLREHISKYSQGIFDEN